GERAHRSRRRLLPRAGRCRREAISIAREIRGGDAGRSSARSKEAEPRAAQAPRLRAGTLALDHGARTAGSRTAGQHPAREFAPTNVDLCGAVGPDSSGQIQSALAPEALTTFAHFAVSARR